MATHGACAHASTPMLCKSIDSSQVSNSFLLNQLATFSEVFGHKYKKYICDFSARTCTCYLTYCAQ